MAKRIESWLRNVLLRQQSRDGRGFRNEAVGRTLLKKLADKYCHRSRLTPEHAVRIHDRLRVMTKEIDGAVFETGIIVGPGWGPGYAWVYGAIAVFDNHRSKSNGMRPLAGSVLIPGAANMDYFVRKTLQNPTQYHRGYRLWDDLCPVVAPVQADPGMGLVLTRDQVARKDDVRPGDCFLYDLTEVNSPRFCCEHMTFGRAVTFGSCDEMIDAARCRLVFGSLASA